MTACTATRFVAERIHATLCAQVGIGAWLEIIFKMARGLAVMVIMSACVWLGMGWRRRTWSSVVAVASRRRWTRSRVSACRLAGAGSARRARGLGARAVLAMFVARRSAFFLADALHHFLAGGAGR